MRKPKTPHARNDVSQQSMLTHIDLDPVNNDQLHSYVWDQLGVQLNSMSNEGCSISTLGVALFITRLLRTNSKRSVSSQLQLVQTCLHNLQIYQSVCWALWMAFILTWIPNPDLLHKWIMRWMDCCIGRHTGRI
jgi:hypothetical protein